MITVKLLDQQNLGFKKINLKPGEEIPVEFLVEPEMFAYYNDMEWIVAKDLHCHGRLLFKAPDLKSVVSR